MNPNNDSKPTSEAMAGLLQALASSGNLKRKKRKGVKRRPGVKDERKRVRMRKISRHDRKRQKRKVRRGY